MRKEDVVTCSKVLQYHVSHLSTGANIFAKPSQLVSCVAGFLSAVMNLRVP